MDVQSSFCLNGIALPDTNKMRSYIAYWCPWRRKFRRGSEWVAYTAGVKQLEKGFEIIWLGDVCVYDGACWKIGNSTVSVYEFGEALRATDPDESMEAALLSMNDGSFPLNDDAALLSFLRIPAISYPLLFQLSSLAQYRRQARRILHNYTEEHPKKVRKLVAWRFDSAAVGDELQRIIILTEWASGSNEEYRTLSWEPESKLHAICKPLLLAFWKRGGRLCKQFRQSGGGRDSSIQIRGGYFSPSSQYLVHAIQATRVRRSRREYLLDWVGYEDPTWEDGANISEELKQKYNAKV